jgi:hypothetical protein
MDRGGLLMECLSIIMLAIVAIMLRIAIQKVQKKIYRIFIRLYECEKKLGLR